MSNNDTPIEVIAVRDLHRGNHRIPLQGSEHYLEWNSRSHRKRRNPVVCLHASPVRERSHWVLWGLQWGNLSWWVAFLFTLGSTVWLFNGTLALWPIPEPVLEARATALSALLGGFIFILGAYAAWLEVINRPAYIHAHRNLQRVHAHPSHHTHRHQHQPGRYTYLAWEGTNWAWWLNTLQLTGALIFFVACAAGVLIPMHLTFNETTWYWMPQMIGAVLFFVSSLMALIEVQERLWLPAWHKISWHAAFFNAVGAVGFFLCAYYGAYGNSPETLYWGSDVSTFWGSIAFLISSYLMMVEILNP